MEVSDIFYFFSLLGEGEGGVRGARRGGSFFIENARRGEGFPGGAEGPAGCLRRIWEFRGGGGLNIFFRGRNVHQGIHVPIAQDMCYTRLSRNHLV